MQYNNQEQSMKKVCKHSPTVHIKSKCIINFQIQGVAILST